MVARLPQQVLLLLVLVTGTSPEAAHGTEEPQWNTYSNRRASKALRATWSSSSADHVTRETKPDLKTPEVTTWSADRSNPGSRLVLEFPKTVVDRSEEDEDAKIDRKVGTKSEGNYFGVPKVSGGVSSITNIIEKGRRSARKSDRVDSTSMKHLQIPVDFNFVDQRSNIVTEMGTRPSKVYADNATTPATFLMKNSSSSRRQMRDVSNECEKFEFGDEAKREFYSPLYPEFYPKKIECVRVLEAEKGMLLKLDFRDEFKIEDSPDCRYDSLEVRDGKYGFSNLLGNFCGSNFPPEITSKTRYLWLKFRSDDNIEDKGFKAVWSMIPRPTYPGVPPEPEPCIINVTEKNQEIISSKHEMIQERKKLAEKEGFPLDCMWIIMVKENWKIQLSFTEPTHFQLQKPNECDANFVDVFSERTDMQARVKNFCGSIADTVTVKNSVAYVRFYAEPKALNSSFEGVMTAVRDKDTACAEGEYDCQDATCIAIELLCNKKPNCRFRWDEDPSTCGKNASTLIDSQHIVIILVVFSLIMFGLSFAFIFNCVRKLVRDHRIIREHIRQSRENRLDELGRKSTPCPISTSRTDIRDRSSESPSLEVVPSKELLPPTTLIAQEYTKELVLEMSYNAKDMNDIHQSNNVSNATQERLQESSEEPEMRDNFCQTRESLFEIHPPETITQPAFTTFGFRAPSAQNGTNHHHHRHHHHHLHQQSPQQSQQSSQPSQQTSQSSQESSQCSGCSPASRGRDGSMGICPKHNPIPAPPGWSMHESSYPIHHGTPYPEPPDYPSYQRFQSPKPSRDTNTYRQSPKFVRQATVGSGERYGSSIYGSGHGSNSTPNSQHSSTPKCQQTSQDPRYRAEAVIEVDQRRPFSIESTKSAPDVIATH